MGIIGCQLGVKTSSTLLVKKSKISAEEILKKGTFNDLIKSFNYNDNLKLNNVILKQLKPISISISQFLNIDNLWLSMTLFNSPVPNWQGFMSKITHGLYDCSTIIYNPMIPTESSDIGGCLFNNGFCAKSIQKNWSTLFSYYI